MLLSGDTLSPFTSHSLHSQSLLPHIFSQRKASAYLPPSYSQLMCLLPISLEKQSEDNFHSFLPWVPLFWNLHCCALLVCCLQVTGRTVFKGQILFPSPAQLLCSIPCSAHPHFLGSCYHGIIPSEKQTKEKLLNGVCKVAFPFLLLVANA